MGELVDRVRSLALALGGPGLALLVVMVTRRPGAMVVYVLLTVAGSVAGCLVMHTIGRKGGEALVRQRFTGEKTERAMAALQRNGVMAVLIPSLLPPPAPFKIFVILAGASRMSPWTFAVAVVLGRGFRYFGEGLLAVWYGERAIAFLEENGRLVALWTGITVLVLGVAYFWWRSRRRPAAATPLPPA